MNKQMQNTKKTAVHPVITKAVRIFLFASPSCTLDLSVIYDSFSLSGNDFYRAVIFIKGLHDFRHLNINYFIK